jgi:hypothetical protein
MTLDEGLDVVGGVGAGVEHHPAPSLREHLVDQLHHPEGSCRATVGGEDEVSGGAGGFGHLHHWPRRVRGDVDHVLAARAGW